MRFPGEVALYCWGSGAAQPAFSGKDDGRVLPKSTFFTTVAIWNTDFLCRPPTICAGGTFCAKHLVVLELTVVNLQHVLHGADELSIALRRDAPALLQPRLELVFFSVWRTVSAQILSTISHSTSRSASNCSVQRARPSGGWEQAKAINWASSWPSSFLGRRFSCSLRPQGPLQTLLHTAAAH